MLAIVIAGLLMRLPYFGAGPMLEDDHFRYRLDGAMTAHALNPYAYSPANLLNGAAPEAYIAVAKSHRDVVEQANFSDLRSIYPGTSQIIFTAAHLIKPWGIDGLRAVLMTCEILTALLCLFLFGYLSLPRHLVMVVWCNPLLAFNLTGQAHVDAAIGPLLLLTVLAMHRGSGLAGGFALGLAVGVKLWPAILAPVLLRSLSSDRAKQVRFLLALGVVSLAVCGPLLFSTLSSNSGLVSYAGQWSINNWPYEWLSYFGYLLTGGDALDRYLRAALALLCAGIGLALAIRPVADLKDLIARLAVLSACVFYLSPAQFPWYAYWFIPFAALARNWALLAATAALPTYYLFFPLAEAGWRDTFRFGVSGLHLLPVVAIGIATWYTLPIGPRGPSGPATANSTPARAYNEP